MNLEKHSIQKPIKKIAIIFAMETEAQPSIERFNMVEIKHFFDERLRMKCYKTTTTQGEIFIIVNGESPDYQGIYRVGTQAAALAGWESIRLIEPDILISAGTAGGFKEKRTIVGTVFLSTNGIYYHDRRIPLGEYEKYGRGGYKSFSAPLPAKKLGLKLGIISSGNSLTMNKDDLAELKKSGADVKEMEAAAIAEIASLCGINFIALKAITNIIGINSNAPEEFEKHFNLAVDALTDKLVKFVKLIIGKKPEELLD